MPQTLGELDNLHVHLHNMSLALLKQESSAQLGAYLMGFAHGVDLARGTIHSLCGEEEDDASEK